MSPNRPQRPHRPRRPRHPAVPRLVAVSALLVAAAASSMLGPTSTAAADGGDCDAPVTAEMLNDAFGESPDGLVGADYQRAYELPDGRMLWTFQDAYVDDGAGGPTLVHNAAMVQTGSCFELLHGGSEASPESWVGAESTDPFDRWYWPLDGYVRDDDTLVLYVAEVREPGPGYLERTEPVATWAVEVDLDTMTAGPLERAPNPGDELYGFSVTTDDDHVYLYAQCHRQFGFSDYGHDPCVGDVFVARQPLDLPPSYPLEYWTGDGWSRNSSLAVNVAPETRPDGSERVINPMQVERDGDRWIAVTKVGDWWADEVFYDVAPRPEGPWTTVSVEPVSSGDMEVASYFASLVPTDNAGWTVAISHNRWDGELSSAYRPRFTSVDHPWTPQRR
jgi:hypothetical protein